MKVKVKVIPISKALYLVKELGHMLLLNLNTKAHIGSPLIQLHLTLVTFKGLCQGH